MTASAQADTRHDAELVSRASGSGGAAANAAAGDPAIAANGRAVAFASDASNLDPAATNESPQVYVRDLKAETTSLVSRATGPTGSVANSASFLPSISADGRFVAFASLASNFVAGTSNNQIYVRDLVAQTTTLVSKGASGEPGNGGSTAPRISADGRFVAFYSRASNLHPDYPSSFSRQIYVADLATGELELASREQDGEPLNDDFDRGPGFSASGSRIAFTTYRRFPGVSGSGVFGDRPGLYMRDLTTGELTLASRADGRKGEDLGAEYSDSISSDGTRVPFAANVEDVAPGQKEDEAQLDAFVRDLDDNRTIWVSRGFGEERARGERWAIRPIISGNGRVVSFVATGPFGTSSRGGAQGLFVRDLRRKKTMHVGGTPGNGGNRALQASLSSNGRLLAFSSNSSRLDPDDGDRERDVFVVRSR